MKNQVSWLREQVAVDLAVIERNSGSAGISEEATWPDYQTYSDEETAAASDYIEQFRPSRMRAECDAKERILAWYESAYDDIGGIDYGYQAGSTSNALPELLHALALPYSDRPGYREEWKP